MSMMRLTIGLLPIPVLYVLQLWVPFETVQLWAAFATLPVAVLFIIAYIPERPWRGWFATSLLVLAIAVLAYTLSAVFFRLYGPGYAGRNFIVITSVGLVFSALLMRTWVLLAAQAYDQRGLGWFLTRHSRRIYRTFMGR